MPKFKIDFELELLGHEPIKPEIVEAKDEEEARQMAMKKIEEEFDWEYIEESLQPLLAMSVKKIEEVI